MNELIITTVNGRVRGSRDNGAARFLGIPYAASPLGPRRFALPEPAPAWEGVLEATAPGPNAPQIHRPFSGLDVTTLVRPGWHRGDNFLALNVWTPDPEAGGLPVMVFIHGGAFVVGDKDAPVQDGSGFARSGVVCVSINYRMGVEGFLPIPGAPTNLGLRDQLAALEWVQSNIESFGGDPGNVTVFGESAGAMSVADLLASPLAAGLFRRAIIQSGHGAMVRPIEIAERLVWKIAKMLRIQPTVEGFRSRTVEQCLAALNRVQLPWARIDLRDADGRESAFGLSRFLPVYGDDVLPNPPIDSLAEGSGSGIELLIGTNREEMNLYLVPTGLGRKIPAWLVPIVLRKSEPNARAILADYGLKQKGRKTGDVFAAAASDLVFRLPARRFASAHQGKTFFYEFDWRSPACGGQLGACHGMELPFVFDTLECCTGTNGLVGTNPPQELADNVHSIWAAFATDGQVPWPEYDSENRTVFTLESGTVVRDPEIPAARHLP